MYILFKTGPLLITVPFGTERVLTYINISVIIEIYSLKDYGH